MNTLYVILSVLVAYATAIESNSTTALSGVRIAYTCYYCSNCPQPFNPNSASVTRVATNNGFCATMSSSSSPSALATRGAAPPGICTYSGCSWKYVNGVYTYVCCCGTDLCNGPRQTTINCFYCSNCPRPFYQYDVAVSRVESPTGWCAKMGLTSAIDGVYTRGTADSSLCTWNGCSWKNINGVTTYVCCCSRNLCNTGVSKSQSIIAVLSAAFMMTVVAFKSF